jgi:hypothetical protein
VFIAEEVLKIAREVEKATAEKPVRMRRRKRPTGVEVKEIKDNPVEDVPSETESDCIVVARR